MDETNYTNLNKNDKTSKSGDEINLIPILSVLLRRLWLIVFVALIFGTAIFSVSKFLVAPTYRSSFTAYVNNRSQLSNGQDSVSGSDLTASQELVRAYSKIITSRAVLLSAAKSISIELSYNELSDKVSTKVESDTGIITVYVVDSSPDGSYNLAKAIAETSPNTIADIIEGSSMRIIDNPQIPSAVFKPNYVKNTIIGCLLGAFIAVVYIVIRFMLDDKVKTENDLEGRFSFPVVGVIPDMNYADKNSSNYYDYEYAYRNNEIIRSGGRNGKEK